MCFCKLLYCIISRPGRSQGLLYKTSVISSLIVSQWVSLLTGIVSKSCVFLENFIKGDSNFSCQFLKTHQKKSRIRETKQLSTDADSSTDTKQILLVRQNSLIIFFLCGDFTPFIRKSCQIWDHFFPLLFPKNSENLKSFDIWL